MVKQVAYIGDSRHHRAFLFDLNENFDIQLEEFRFADLGLEALMTKKYSLVIVRDEVAADKLNLNGDVRLDDYCGIACLVIEKTREDSPNKNSPIVVPHVGSSLTPVRRYMKSGATKCIDTTKYLGSSLENFREQLRPYLT